MPEFKDLLIALVVFFFSFSVFSQDNICDCCSYASLQYQQDYDEIFSPSLIKSERIKEVVVYTKAKSDLDSIQFEKYKEIKFKFNKNGQVILKTHYNRRGKPHSTYELKRNRYGKIYQQVFNYIDSLEQKADFFSSEIIDYTYDTRRRLLKIKERDYKGKVLPDNKAKYTLFRYDNKNRVVNITNHRNYNDESSISITKYLFEDDSLSSTFQVLRNGKLSTSGKSTYNRNWKLLTEKIYNEVLNSMAFDCYYEYDKNDRLVKFKSVSGPGSADECPEDNTFIDTYKYDSKGFLININHTFRNNSCEMTFEYRK